MRVSALRVLATLIVFGCSSSIASASTISIGLFSFDDLGGISSFNVTNLTGPAALPPDFPIETPLTITITGLSAARSGGGTLTLGSSAFASDAAGNVNCTATGDASTGGCNFAAYDLLSATLTGTLSPTSALLGLPSGFSGIESAFSVTLLPSGGNVLTVGDFVGIDATLVADTTPVPVPEPSTMLLLQAGLTALAGRKFRHYLPLKRLRDRSE
jgi:hypothetical protein